MKYMLSGGGDSNSEAIVEPIETIQNKRKPQRGALLSKPCGKHPAHTCTHITLERQSAGIVKRNPWERPYTGAIRTRRVIGGNREAKSILKYFYKIQVPSVPGGNREAKSLGYAIILAGPCAQGM